MLAEKKLITVNHLIFKNEDSMTETYTEMKVNWNRGSYLGGGGSKDIIS